MLNENIKIFLNSRRYVLKTSFYIKNTFYGIRFRHDQGSIFQIP